MPARNRYTARMTLRSVVVLFAVSAGAGLLVSSQVSESAAPDLILVGGRVYTLDSKRPWAEALAVRGDRIAGVGTSAEMRQAAGSSTRVIDLKGAFVSPGFNDGHVHVESTGALLTGANLLDVHEAKTFRERIAQAAHGCRPAAGSRAATGARTSNGDRAARAHPQQQARQAAPSCRIDSSSTT